MTKTTERLEQLFTLHLKQSGTVIEQEEFWGYVNDPMYEQEVKELVAALYSESENASMISEDERAAILAHVFSTQRKSVSVIPSIPRKLNLWPRIGIAAAAAAITLSIWLYYTPRHPDAGQDPALAIQNDIAPGIQGATLTLANGKKIKLTNAANGELAKEAGVTVTKTANGQLIYTLSPLGGEMSEGQRGGAGSDPLSPQGGSLPEGERSLMNTLSTANGETYQVRLPDGSLVALNAASSLAYPANFTALKERRVKLTGEGYFEIAKDKAHPFIVATEQQEVKVLGTHFNINSYADEPSIKTTLLEGTVQVSSLVAAKNKILKPGEQADLKGTEIGISIVDVDEAIAWKNNKFMFDNESIESIMRKLSRWYNVEVVYEGNVRELPFTGSISRYDNISKILDKIMFTQDVHFKVEGRRITVKP